MTEGDHKKTKPCGDNEVSQAFAWRAGELMDEIASGVLNITVSEHYPLAEAARAHQDLQDRKTVGSIVLVP